jgi:hypothetical protein
VGPLKLRPEKLAITGTEGQLLVIHHASLAVRQSAR